MKYLLDTDICIYIINEKPQKILRRFEQYPVHEFGVSSITQAELQYGVAKSTHKKKNQRALNEFLLPLTILPFHGDKLVTCYGDIRARLESKGKTIGPLDMLIAAHALSLDVTLITHNTREFSQVSNLKYEDWGT